MRNFMSCNKTVEGVLQHFDFDKVHHVMEALDWKWASYDSYNIEEKVPSIVLFLLTDLKRKQNGMKIAKCC